MYDDLNLSETFLPVIFELSKDTDKEKFDELISIKPDKILLDLFPSQKQELFKIRSPKQRLSPAETEILYSKWIADRNSNEEGVWVYYPWLNRIIHILNREEFIELRTSRNQFKITPSEQTGLFGKKIGIIGLSVGHAVALSIATERICSKLKLADFDTIELSNLNRIKTGIQNIGLNKCVVTAREIAEIDPFLEIECYQEGITEGNLESFLMDDGKLDILIDECDGLEIKIACRQMAKKYQIPVVMETSDKGMLDVERFDLENDRPILHGYLEGIPEERLKNISPEDRLPLVLKIIDARNSSLRGQLSLIEIGQTISTWPQLASAVTLGGGVVTDVCRRILLNQYNESGRYYVDLESIIGNKIPEAKTLASTNPYEPFSFSEAVIIADTIPAEQNSAAPDNEIITDIIKAAGLAPSNANDQPWKWLYRNSRLYLFHDQCRSHSFAGFGDLLPHIALGAAYENVLLKANQHGFKIKSQLFPLESKQNLVAVIDFHKTDEKTDIFEVVYAPESVEYIAVRSTNRNPSQPFEISDQDLKILKDATESIPDAELHFISDKQKILDLGEIIGSCERINLLNDAGHKDFYQRDIRWTPEESAKSGDGIDVQNLGMVPAQLAAYSIIKDPKIAQTLKNIDGGNALVDGMIRNAGTASGIGIITISGTQPANYFLGGIAMQRLWLKAEALGYAIYPFSAPLHLFPRLRAASDSGLDTGEIQKLVILREKFQDIIPSGTDQAEIFVFKIAKAEKPSAKSARLPLSEILLIKNNEM
ncbi:Rv1355c family protein [Dyadobacter sp. CY356]|uniref:Rv1355c family protein n=1 Tax=Dyadobacter sp. CY356 TaxID=2906442 RepID=UPI001F0241FA|nr:Rv1355c family protein [Dyadobacter sp. CY356]MCF0057223.1 Rv1355c family protein [Dyadobacter sp. CY356]